MENALPLPPDRSTGVSRASVTAYLDQLLSIDAIPADKSANGLQVQGAERITKIAGAVDGCQAIYEEAIRRGAQFVFVHHGEFWGSGIRGVTGRLAQRFGTLLRHDISLYAAHLPLDADRDIGHNACLARLLELQEPTWFCSYAGVKIGVHGTLPAPMSPAELMADLDRGLATSCTALLFGTDRISRAAVISGAGAGALEECAALGIDVLITGEFGHTEYHVAKELGINLIGAGHYATETPGIHAVLAKLAEKFPIETTFIDHPTGL